jgi:hypothetical protein
MAQKTISQLDVNGYFVGPTTADESPLEPGVFLIPFGAVDTAPPDVPEGQRAQWTGTEFVFEDIPEPEPEPVWEPEPEPETPERLVARVTVAIQTRLDDFARTRNYDGILSAATYAASSIERFRSEGEYAINARDATWAKAYELLAELLAEYESTGILPDIDDVLAQLPALQWP